MEVIQIANEIVKLKEKLDQIRKVIKKRGIDYARDHANYRKILAITIIKLKNGIEMELEGQKIKNPTATSTNEIARGICWEEKQKEEESLALVKAGYSNLKTVQLQLSAMQSILKRFDNL